MKFLSWLLGAVLFGAGLGLFKWGHPDWQVWLGFSLIFAGLQCLISSEIHDALEDFRSQVRDIADAAVEDAFTERDLEAESGLEA